MSKTAPWFSLRLSQSEPPHSSLRIIPGIFKMSFPPEYKKFNILWPLLWVDPLSVGLWGSPDLSHVL
ncbi:hypothetical protein RchiOBHm_Chr2g0128831 [Rosa chinensis]|uniref:Uncharacterized protein n=1 Tax=Rosa chinensis TaxID=74649 RepID=A0A2P6RUE9_ROSCH|nr:hypothetical protein RchiOBHm_Chr2g0128831 [Rosa chinensis]